MPLSFIPTDLVQVATYGGQSYYVQQSEIDSPRTHLRPYTKTGEKDYRPGRSIYREPQWVSIHRANITEIGAPRLLRGWKVRAQIAHGKMIAEVLERFRNAPTPAPSKTLHA